MSDQTNPIEEGAALRSGLQALYDPQPSSDFDSQVLTALQKPQTWWQTLWQNSKPMVASGAFSLVVMLVLIASISKGPMEPAAPATATMTTQINSAALDKILERPNLRADALIRYMPPEPESLQPQSNAGAAKRDRPPVRKALQPLSLSKRELSIA